MAPMSNPGTGPDSESPANRTSRFRPQVSLAEELVRAQTFTGANGAALASLEGDALVWLGAVGENPPKAGDRWSLAGSFATLCLGRKTRPQRCDDVEADGRMDASFRALRAKSLALAPVHDAGKVTGILAVFSGSSRAFNGMHAAVLQTEADSLAELVQQARQAAGFKDEEQDKGEARPDGNQAATEAPALLSNSGSVAPAVPPAAPQQRELEALESAFVVVPPSATSPAAPATATPAATTVPASLPKLRVVPTPPPSAPPVAAPERPTLPGFLPLSATAAALAKAKPMPPMPPEMAIETKAPKLAGSLPPAPEAKKPAASVASKASAPAPAPPSSAAAVSTPPPAPVVATPKPSAPPLRPSDSPAVKFVPLAKPPEVKTPPPGSLKPPVPATPQNGSSSSARKNAEDRLLPAAADPFAEFSPVHFRPPRLGADSGQSSLALDEMEGKVTVSAGIWKLPLLVAVVVAVALGGMWLRARYLIATPGKAASVAVQPAPAPPVNSAVPSTQPPAESTAAPPTTPAPQAVPTSAAAVTTGKVSLGKDVAQVKTGPTPEQEPPSAAVDTPADLEVRSPAPVAVVPHHQEPPPKTLLSVPVATSAKLPDLPKPAVPAPEVLRQASTPVAAQLVQRVTPQYPLIAKSMHLQGVVHLSATVNARGQVTQVTWISGNSFFKDSAISAVKQWRYKPATLDGQAVESTVEVVLKFSPQ